MRILKRHKKCQLFSFVLGIDYCHLPWYVANWLKNDFKWFQATEMLSFVISNSFFQEIRRINLMIYRMIANSVICNTIKVYNGYFVLLTDIRSLKFKLVAVYFPGFKAYNFSYKTLRFSCEQSTCSTFFWLRIMLKHAQ